ncbi:hypothetical protein OC834_005736, partial [Tilletia horrida]
MPILRFTPLHNQTTHAGYDTAVLFELLKSWRAGLGSRHGQEFTPALAMTDTDVRERAALASVWPCITLRLCTFHVRQAWNNHKKKHCRLSDEPVLKLLGSSLASLHQQIIQSDSVIAARQAVEEVNTTWTKTLSSSGHGIAKASAATGIPVKDIVTTTNHAEGFNNGLKNVHLSAWRQRGRPLRLDMLIIHLALTITPSIYLQRQEAFALAQARQALAPALFLQSQTSSQPARFAFLEPDAERDLKANEMCDRGLLMVMDQMAVDKVEAMCFASTTNLANFLTADVSSDAPPNASSAPTIIAYHVSIWLISPSISHPPEFHANALASCQCEDMQQRGGACKHVRALLLSLPSSAKDWKLPTSEKESIFLTLNLLGQAGSAACSQPSEPATLQQLPRCRITSSSPTESVPNSVDSTTPFDFSELIDWGEDSDSGSESDACGEGEGPEDGVDGPEVEDTCSEDEVTENVPRNPPQAQPQPLLPAPTDQGLHFQAHNRLRHDTNKAVGMLADVLRQSSILGMDFEEWAEPSTHN